MPDDGIFYDADADPDALKGKTIAILGYGSQGHAHALNLKESGYDVVVGLRADSASRAEAEAAGLEVLDIADAASRGDVVMVLLPDEKQAEVWEAEICDGIAPGNLLMFAHGFAIHFGADRPPPAGVDVGMVAPKGPGPPRPAPVRGGQGRPLPDGGRTRTRPATPATWCSPTRAGSAAGAPGSSRRPSRTSARPTSSASRRCSAAAPPSWCAPASRPWSRRATTRASPTSRPCTS